MSSNIGSSLFIGLAGQAAVGGLAVGGFEWNVRISIKRRFLFFGVLAFISKIRLWYLFHYK